MKKSKLILFTGTVLAVLAGLSSCHLFDDDEEKVTKDGMTLVWEDDFNYNGKPDTAKWKYQTGAGGWGNQELQNYIDNTQDATTAVCDGQYLHIKAFNDNGTWKSARMNSKESWKYGWIEARLKVTDRKGAWPAFWMMPQDSKYGQWPTSGEIDIMENAPSTCGDHVAFSTLHAKDHNSGQGASIGKESFGDNFKNEWHTFAVKWTEDRITALYDDKVVGSFNNSGAGFTDWPYDQNFYIILNLAIGGNLGGTGDVGSLNGACEFLVDYVRVYQ